MADFEQRLIDFIAALDKLQEDHYREHLTATFNAHGAPKHTLERGPKYIRVVTTHIGTAHRAVYCFLDHEGRIFKAESWKKPAKHVRGSIYDDNFSIGKGLTFISGECHDLSSDPAAGREGSLLHPVGRADHPLHHRAPRRRDHGIEHDGLRVAYH